MAPPLSAHTTRTVPWSYSKRRSAARSRSGKGTPGEQHAVELRRADVPASTARVAAISRSRAVRTARARPAETTICVARSPQARRPPRASSRRTSAVDSAPTRPREPD
jgi:hypothetical protein